jgi:hypothetical protein
VPLPIIEQTLELTGKIDGGNHEHVLNEKTSKVNSEEDARFADGIANDDVVKIIGGVILAHTQGYRSSVSPSKNEECPISIFIKIQYFSVR